MQKKKNKGLFEIDESMIGGNPMIEMMPD